MKKIAVILVSLLLPFVMMAQLPYDTELTKDHFEGSAVISKSDNCAWVLGSIAVGDLTNVPFMGLVDPKENSCVVVLPQEGLPLQMDFQYRSLNQGTISVEESTDMTKWTAIWSQSVETELIEAVSVTAKLSSSTRYIRLHYTGYSRVYFSKLKVTEKKELSANIEEYTFPTAKVDDAISYKTIDIKWTNVVTTVSSSNPAFTVSPTTIGQKNEEDKTTQLTVGYSHENYGTQQGDITIAGEGLSVTIHVSGTTERYPQKLYWTDALGTRKTTDQVRLNAITDSQLPVTYTIKNPEVAELGENNILVVKCAGTTDIMAKQVGDRKYLPTDSIVKTITFVKADPVVAMSAKSITYGQRLREVQISESLGLVAGTTEFRNISVDTILDAGAYVLQVAFVPDEACIYNEVTHNVALEVAKAAQTVEWMQSATRFYEGDTIDLTAYASSHLPLTYAYTNCNVHIEDNQMTGVDVGNVQVIAFQDGDKNYLPSTVAKQSFEVIENPNYTPYVPVIHDTVVVRDTILVPNTIVVRDTVLVPDTIFISDTVVVYDTVIVYDTPVVTSERMIEADPSVAELEEKGQKYYQNGRLYIYYRRRLYNAEGQLLK